MAKSVFCRFLCQAERQKQLLKRVLTTIGSGTSFKGKSKNRVTRCTRLRGSAPRCPPA
ncbi:hypothetical protein DsansV1_C07g0074491 [Dioscorea sansibarensis]